MKKIFLFLVLCGTSFFVMPMDGVVDIDDSDSDGGYASGPETDSPETEEERMASQEQRNPIRFPEIRNRVRFEGEQPLNNGVDSSASGTSSSENTFGAEAEENEPSPEEIKHSIEKSVERGLSFSKENTFSDGLTPDQIERIKSNREAKKEAQGELDGIDRQNELGTNSRKSSTELRAEIENLESQYNGINDRLEELDKFKEFIERRPTGDANRNSASKDLLNIKKEESQLFNRRNDIAVKIEGKQEVLDQREPLSNESIVEDSESLTSLGQEVAKFRSFEKGTRTVQEYNQLKDGLTEAFNKVTDEITELENKERALGYKEIKKRGWFGRITLEPDYTDVSQEDRGRLDTIQKQKEMLENLKSKAMEEYSNLEETNPEEGGFFKRQYRKFWWGSLSKDPAPERGSLGDWERVSDKRNLSDDQLNTYKDTLDPYGSEPKVADLPGRKKQRLLKAREQLRQEYGRRGQSPFSSQS